MSEDVWKTFGNEQLLERLIEAGTAIPAGLPEAIVARGEGIVEPLGRILLDERNRADDASEGWSWVRSHSFILLGLIGSPKAAPAVLDYFRLGWDLDDIIAEDGAQVLGLLGPGAIEPIAAFVGEKDGEPILRAVAAQGLVNIGYFHPEERRRIAGFFRDALDKAIEENDWEIGEWLVLASVCIDDDEVQERIKTFFDSDDMVYGVVCKEDAAIIQDREAAWAAHDPEKDLWYYFSEAFFARCRQVEEENERWREQERQRNAAGGPKPYFPDEDDDWGRPTYTEPFVWAKQDRPKIGRNEPCYCGSGKKYKKCCWDKDRGR